MASLRGFKDQGTLVRSGHNGCADDRGRCARQNAAPGNPSRKAHAAPTNEQSRPAPCKSYTHPERFPAGTDLIRLERELEGLPCRDACAFFLS